jgi:hypothetical protein
MCHGSRHHKQCVLALQAYEKRVAVGVQVSLGGQGTICASIVDHLREENCNQLSYVFEIIKFIGGNGFPFQGHHESIELSYRGCFCFLEQRNFSMVGCPDFNAWVESHPKKATYMSPDIQNEMIDIIAKAGNCIKDCE